MTAQTTELWLPTHEPEPHFDIPLLHQLTEAWIGQAPGEVMALPDEIYGVAEKPQDMPSAIVSVDLCEVVRETGLSVIELRGGTLDDMVTDPTTGEMDYGSTINGWPDETAQEQRQRYIQHLMHHGHVRPTPYAESIATFMQKWRANGVYVIANTSTLPGCELSTVRFLHDVYPGCFQGVLFPRNHDGRGKTTKAMALNATVASLQREHQSHDSPVAFAIDDAMHHADDLDATGAEVFVPAYAWNEALDGHSSITRVARNLGTVDSFMALDQRLSTLFNDSPVQ